MHLCWEDHSAWRITSSDHPNTFWHQLLGIITHQLSTTGDLRMAFTMVRGHINEDGGENRKFTYLHYIRNLHYIRTAWTMQHLIIGEENSTMHKIASYWQPILLCSFHFCRFQRCWFFAWAGFLFFLTSTSLWLISISLFGSLSTATLIISFHELLLPLSFHPQIPWPDPDHSMSWHCGPSFSPMCGDWHISRFYLWVHASVWVFDSL